MIRHELFCDHCRGLIRTAENRPVRSKAVADGDCVRLSGHTGGYTDVCRGCMAAACGTVPAQTAASVSVVNGSSMAATMGRSETMNQGPATAVPSSEFNP